MTARKPPASYRTADFAGPPTGGEWVAVPADGQQVQRLRQILNLLTLEGVMISSHGDYYLVGDGAWGYVIRNQAGPLDCACNENRDGTGACSHIWALRAVRGEFFPDWIRDTSKQEADA